MIQLQSSFENPLPSGWQDSSSTNYSPFGLIEGSESWSHAIVTDIKRSGNSAWRMEVRPGDGTAVFGSYRSEITFTTKASAVTYLANSYRISCYIPADAWSSSSQEEIFPFQFHPHHATYTGGSPSLAIEIKDDKWRVAIRHTNGNTSTSATQIEQWFPKDTISRGKWVDFVFYYDPAGGSTNGRVKIWRRILGVDSDYQVWFDYTGRCLHSWSRYPFWKGGIYWWNRPASGSASQIRRGYIDMVAFGQSTLTGILGEFGIPGLVANLPPVANAGADKSIELGATATLTGTATDPENAIAAPVWTQLSGPVSATILTPNNWNTTVANLSAAGNYTFRLTVADPQGASGTDDVVVTVLAPTPVYTFTDIVANKTIQCLSNGTWKQI